MKNGKSAITAVDLTKKFGDFVAVSEVSFEVGFGEIFGFLGPNGSGKTTTIRMMLGLLKPTAGQVNVLGMEVDDKTIEIRQQVGYMSQRFSLYNDLTVKQNLQFYGMAYGLSNADLKNRIKESIQLSGLEGREDTQTKNLSGGWRQRLALSAAIIHHPTILFLDEPTAGVDPVSRRAFWNLLYEQAASGVTIFVTTHYMDEAEHCQRLAFIRHGMIIAQGSPEQIKNEIMPGQVLEIAPSDPEGAVEVVRSARNAGRLQIDDVELFGNLIHVIASDLEKQQPIINFELRQADIDPGPMALIEPTLEDVFIASMRKPSQDIDNL
jgi:ABC-2 type transport system ATP-binding protein